VYKFDPSTQLNVVFFCLDVHGNHGFSESTYPVLTDSRLDGYARSVVDLISLEKVVTSVETPASFLSTGIVRVAILVDHSTELCT